MFHTHTYAGHRTWSFREARLCHNNRPSPEQELRGPATIRQNPSLSNALGLYDNIFARYEAPESAVGRGAQFAVQRPGIVSEFGNPELNRFHPADRTMFKALLLSGMLTDLSPASLRFQDRTRINAIDPFNVVRAGDTNEAIGWRMQSMLEPAQLARLFPGRDQDPELLGQAVRDRRDRGTGVWQRNGDPNHATDADLRLFLEMPIEVYKAAKERLDRMLLENRISPPNLQSSEGPSPRPGAVGGAGNQRLGRREYLTLLALQIRLHDFTSAIIPGNPLGTFQALVKVTRDQVDLTNRLQMAYRLVGIEELGATETLNGWGISLGHDTRRTYIQRRRRPQSLPVMPRPNPALGRPGQQPFLQAIQTGIPEQQLTNSIPSAAEWRANPALAVAFLEEMQNSGAMPRTDGNNKFLAALRHFALPTVDWNRNPVNDLTAEDTRAILDITVDSLVGSEQIQENSLNRREELRKQLTASQHVSGFLNEMKDIVTDGLRNPTDLEKMLPAAIIGIGGFLVFRQMYRYLFKTNKSPLEKTILLSAFGALAVGIVQERRTGTAFWDGTAKSLQDWWNGTESAPTLSGYWSRELGQNNVMTERLLAILHDQKVNDVVAFYDQMKAWQNRRSPAGQQPPLPQTMNFAGFEFGQMGPREKGMAMYQLLKRFFQNRGRSLADQGPQYGSRVDVAEERGRQYIFDRYTDPRYFTNLVAGHIEPIPGSGVRVQGSILPRWGDPANQQLLYTIGRQNPVALRNLVVLHQMYVEEQSNPGSRNYEMWNVFLFEADDGALRNMGSAGARAANLRERIQRRVEQIVQRNVPFVAPPNENAERVDLLARNGTLNDFTSEHWSGNGNFVAHANESAGERESVWLHIDTGWREFLDRVPVSAEARRSLEADGHQYILTNINRPFSEVVNELERRKYQVLMAAAQSPERLSKEIVDRLPNNASDSERLTWWTNRLPDLLRTVGNSATFPRITSLADVRNFQLQHSALDPLRKKVNEIEVQMRRLRAAPFALVPAGTAAPTAESVEALDRQMGHLVANEVLMAFISRHTRTPGTVTPIPTQQMQISTPEVENLVKFTDDLYNRMVPRNAITRLEAMDKKATELAASIPDMPLDVRILGNGTVSISLSSPTVVQTATNFAVRAIGVISNERFMSLAEYNDRFPASSNMFIFRGVTHAEFETQTVAQLKERWIEEAVRLKKASIEFTAPAAGPTLKAARDWNNFRMQRAGNNIEYTGQPAFGVVNNETATSPLNRFLRTDNAEIYERYNQWVRTPAATRPASPPADPLTLP